MKHLLTPTVGHLITAAVALSIVWLGVKIWDAWQCAHEDPLLFMETRSEWTARCVRERMYSPSLMIDRE